MANTDRADLKAGFHRPWVWFAMDAAVTGANGVAYVALAPALDTTLGIPSATLAAIGASLAVFAFIVAWHAHARARNTAIGAMIVGINMAWVVVSVAVAALGLGGITTIGRVWAVLQATAVAALTVAQMATLRNERSR